MYVVTFGLGYVSGDSFAGCQPVGWSYVCEQLYADEQSCLPVNVCMLDVDVSL